MEYKIITPNDKKYPEKLKERLGDSVPEKIYYNGVIGAGVHLSKHYGRYRFE